MKKKTSETVIVEGRFYTIASPNGRVLEVANYNPESGAAIQLWDYAGAQWQQWTFVPVGADTYRICNRFTGKAIDLCLGGTADGTWLHQWDCNTGRGQQWKLEPTEDGYVRFRSVLAGKYLDLYQAFSGNGGRAHCVACFHALFHRAGSIVNDRFESGAFSSKLLSAGFALEFTID